MASSHSRTRKAHRGPRHEADPDRRVKWVLRFRRKGEETTPEWRVVRRHRRAPEKVVDPGGQQLRKRMSKRRQRRQARQELKAIARELSAPPLS